MKKLLTILLLLAGLFTIAACGPTEETPTPEAKAPVLVGIQNSQIQVGDAFDPRAGITASDEVDGNLTSAIVVTGTVNTGVAGTYTLTYSVTNAAGKTTTVTRTVTVIVGQLEAVPANGTFDYKFATTELRHTFFAAAEKYLLNNLYGGVPVFANAGFNLYSSRLQLPVQQFVPVMGFGTAYATMTADDSSVIMDNNALGQVGKYTYRAALSTNPVTLNQWLYNDAVSADAISPFLDTLYSFEFNQDKTGYVVVPSMASGDPIPVNPETLDSGKIVAKTWQIPIREGLTWKYHASTVTTGFPAGHAVINAHDFVNTYKLALDNGWFRAISGGGHFWASTSPVVGAKAYRDAVVAGSGANWDSVGIKVIDDQKIQFTFDSNLSDWNIRYWLSSFVMTPINLELYNSLQVGTTNSYGTTPQTTAYHGFYHLEVFEKDKVLRYSKNNLFHDQDKYFYTGQNYVIIEDAAIRFQEFVAGKLEAATVPTERYDSFKNHPGLKRVPGATTFRIMINGLGTAAAQEELFPGSAYIPEPLLANQNFKKAMYFAVDREKLATEVLKTSQTQQFLFTQAYLVDPELGIAFRDTPQGQSVGEGLSVETNGFNFDASVAFYKAAIAQLVADGVYVPGTAAAPREIEVKLFIFTGSAAQVLFGDYIKAAYEAAFKDDVNHINVKITVEAKAFPGIYYDFMMTGLFDLSIGGISGSTLDASGFLDVFSSDNRGGFTLNWGIDTTVPEIEVTYTNNAGQLVKEIWSYDAIVSALNGEVVVVDGREVLPE
jgi:ABC-type oligopeptide transport system substrate-binding subunit